MNKNSIKVIKRKDVEAAANARIQAADEPKQIVAPPDSEKSKRSSRREIAGTILNWISERRENNRIETDAEYGWLFSDKSF